jgi:hypothetical protein
MVIQTGCAQGAKEALFWSACAVLGPEREAGATTGVAGLFDEDAAAGTGRAGPIAFPQWPPTQ